MLLFHSNLNILLWISKQKKTFSASRRCSTPRRAFFRWKPCYETGKKRSIHILPTTRRTLTRKRKNNTALKPTHLFHFTKLQNKIIITHAAGCGANKGNPSVLSKNFACASAVHEAKWRKRDTNNFDKETNTSFVNGNEAWTWDPSRGIWSSGHGYRRGRWRRTRRWGFRCLFIWTR